MKQKLKLNCILLIDDDEPTNFFSQMILEESGFTRHIRIVQSGREALEYLLKCSQPGCDEIGYPKPDLILLDINMPAMNGWEFINEYKKLNKEQCAETLIVMLTTSLFPEDVAMAERMPEISGFENKPLTAEKVENILQNHFFVEDGNDHSLHNDETAADKQAVKDII